MIKVTNPVRPLILLLLISSASAQQSVPENIQRKLINGQQLIVSALSGKSKIDERKHLKRRWTNNEKALARSFLKTRLSEFGIDAHEQHYEVSLPHKKPSLNPFKGTNLFAIIPASIQTTEYVIIGAHYDSVSESPGAMDNATGCALVYGVGDLIAGLPHRRKNLIIVFFDQEETGHAGSFAFATYIKEKAFNVHSVHTCDMIGWDNDGDRNIELELPTQELESMYKRCAESFGVLAYRTETTETDHREFRNAGFNAVGIGGEYKHSDSSPHHHLSTDTFATVNFEYLAFVTFLVYTVIENLMIE